MDAAIRDHVPAVTGLVTALSLAVVFSAVLGVIPQDSIPAAPSWFVAAIPHVNVVISLAAIVTIGVGWRRIRRGRIDAHRRAMIAATGLFALFLTLYLYRLTLLGGPTPFEGSAILRQFVYLPVLAIHVVLAIACIPFVYYALLLGLTRPATELTNTHHASVGRIAAILWMISFALGIVVYGLLNAI